MIQQLKQLMMTLALLVTAATGAWADGYLFLEIDQSGKSATMKLIMVDHGVGSTDHCPGVTSGATIGVTCHQKIASDFQLVKCQV